jgi:hypothetical protein
MRVKTLVLPLALALSVVGCKRDTTEAAGNGGYAASPGTTTGAGTSAGTTTGSATAMTGAPFTAEVVSVERDGSSITLREAGGKATRRSVSVDPASASSVSGLKAGDKVTVTCNESGGMSGMGSTTGTGSNATGTAGTAGGTTGSGTTTGSGSMGSMGSMGGTGTLESCTSVVSVMPSGR